MTPRQYLQRPYWRHIIPDSDGTYLAKIEEFPGCIATGETVSEAISNLEKVALTWLRVTIAKGQLIPEPRNH